LGFDAAAVDSHRRDGGLLWRCVYAIGADEVVLEELRIDRAQHLANFVVDKDIAAQNE